MLPLEAADQTCSKLRTGEGGHVGVVRHTWAMPFKGTHPKWDVAWHVSASSMCSVPPEHGGRHRLVHGAAAHGHAEASTHPRRATRMHGPARQHRQAAAVDHARWLVG